MLLDYNINLRTNDKDAKKKRLNNCIVYKQMCIIMTGQTTAPEEQTAVILSTSQYIVYQSIWVLGPTIYFANAVIDVKWALIVRNRDAHWGRMKTLDQLCHIGQACSKVRVYTCI